MGRPRKENPETSAQPASGQNTGVEGARHAAADDSPAPPSAEPVLNEPVLNQQGAPVDEPASSQPEASQPEDAGSPEAGGSSEDSAPSEDSGYDETSGIVYEVQPRGLEIFGLKGAEHEDPPGPGTAGTAAAPAASGTPDEPPTVEQPAATTATVTSQAIQGERESRDNPFGKILGWLSGVMPGDGGPPLTRFRNLPLDQKMRIWQIRAILVVAVGLVFTLISGSWQIGLTLAIIAGIADTIYRARTVEAHAWAQPGTVDRATMRAQRRTIRQLAAMERAGYLSLHKRPIPDSEEVIDHLVVGPTGVYAIDSEKWNRDLPIRQSNGKKLWVGPENKNKRLDHACWEAGQASERLSAKLGTEITVQPALAIYGPKISWVVLDVRGVDVFAGPELKKYLRRRARRKGLPRLTNEEIKKIFEAAGGVLPLEWQKTSTPVG